MSIVNSNSKSSTPNTQHPSSNIYLYKQINK